MNSGASSAAAGAPSGGLSLLQAASIAIGTMIGASIFSIFGLGASIAGQNLPLVFVVSGLAALSVAYSYSILGAKIISNAGPMEFILQGFGDNVVTGALSFLFWLSYVVSISLFAKGFAGYFLPLFSIGAGPLSRSLVEAAVLLAFTLLNIAGSKQVGKAEFFIVMVKLGILGLFIVLGMATVQADRIVPVLDEAHLVKTVYGAAVFFLAYMGFGLITNASENIRNPQRDVPRAIFLSIFVVAVVYILVSVVAVGNLPLARLVKAEDFALAEAARPFLGHWGYLLVSIGALFSISSALNATLYGGANIAYSLARDGELPKAFERKTWFGAPEGLYITTGLGLAFTLLLNLNGIASMTSAVAMVIYLFVLAAHYRLAPRVGGKRFLIVVAFLVILAVFVALMDYLWRTNRLSFWACWTVFAASLVVERLWRAGSGRGMLVRELESLRR